MGHCIATSPTGFPFFNAMIGHNAVSEKKMLKNNGNMHVNSPGAGVDNAPGLFVFMKTIFQPTYSFAARFPLQRLCHSFPHSVVQATKFDLAMK